MKLGQGNVFIVSLLFLIIVIFKARINITNAQSQYSPVTQCFYYFSHLSRKIFCEAYRRKMDGKKFQWLIVGMYEEKWWEKGSEETECTAAEIQHALVGTMVLDILPLASNEDITISRRVRLNRNSIRIFIVAKGLLLINHIHHTKIH